MSNKEIAKTFQFLAKIMELHGENSFKTKSYTNAYMTIKKLPDPISKMSIDDISKLNGIGKATSQKIEELLANGTIEVLEKFKSITPVGIQEMLMVKGLGPKKVKTIWDELEVVTPGELLYACNENRLVALKGFGAKTQETLRAQLMYYMDSQDKFHYATVQKLASQILDLLKKYFPNQIHELTGEIRRHCTIINQIDILSTIGSEIILPVLHSSFDNIEIIDSQIFISSCKVNLHFSIEEEFYSSLLKLTGPEEYLKTFDNIETSVKSEQDIYTQLNKVYIPPYLRDEKAYWAGTPNPVEDIVQIHDIKGVIHSHSTWSDGVNSIKEMALKAQSLGYEYLVMTDHSQSAFYANGLNEDRVMSQMEEIDELNDQMDNFVIYKGIESDILNNGALDYDDEILELFDVVIASVHSNLRMDKDKATQRLLTAIENPYTHILGHPTGRLLLSREGYSIDVDAIIQACADNDVVIELNANPHRLDIDWSYIQRAMSAGVQISINPDSHSTAGILDIEYGVLAAQKGGLTKHMCLNTQSLSEFEEWVRSLKY